MIGIVSDPLFLRHENGGWYPEAPERLIAVQRGIDRFEKGQTTFSLRTERATFDELSSIHTKSYIETIKSTSGRPRTFLDAETQTNAQSYDTALLAAGSVIGACRAALQGDCDSAFCAVRPPGHHAESDRAMGFCLFNSVAVAAKRALSDGCDRVAILDWDVHHGNGTMHSLYNDPDILFLSIHQSPHYPGTGSAGEIGAGSGRGFSVNVPVPAGASDIDYLSIFDRIILPVLAQFSPDLLLVSSGFDAHSRDPLASIHLSSQVYAEMTIRILDAMGGRPTVVVLEGGYDAVALEESTLSTLRGLAGKSDYTIPDGAGQAKLGSIEGSIEESINALRPYWKL